MSNTETAQAKELREKIIECLYKNSHIVDVPWIPDSMWDDIMLVIDEHKSQEYRDLIEVWEEDKRTKDKHYKDCCVMREALNDVSEIKSRIKTDEHLQLRETEEAFCMQSAIADKALSQVSTYPKPQ